MNDVFCPFCSTGQSLPHAAAGQTARCKSCGKTFMVPEIPSPRASAPPNRLATATPLMTATPQASYLPRPTAPLPVANDPRSVESPEAAESQEAGGSSISLILLGGMACFIVGGLLLVVVILKLVQRDREHDRPAVAGSADPPRRRSSTGRPKGRGPGLVQRDPRRDHRSQLFGGRRAYVGFGEVRARDAHNRVVVSDQRNYLQVYLKIKNLGAEPVQYVSWQGNSFAASGQQVRATLVDDQGRSYAMQEFAHVAGLQGHTPRAILANKEKAEDVVIFTIPESVDRRTVRYFRLELPAEAYGGSGVYRFEIPPQAIQGFP